MLKFPAFRANIWNLVLTICSSCVILSCTFGYPFKIWKYQKRLHSELTLPLHLQFSFEDYSFKRKNKRNICSLLSPSSEGTQAGWHRKNNQGVLLQTNFRRCFWRETVQPTTLKSLGILFLTKKAHSCPRQSLLLWPHGDFSQLGLQLGAWTVRISVFQGGFHQSMCCLPAPHNSRDSNLQNTFPTLLPVTQVMLIAQEVSSRNQRKLS